MLVPGYNWIMGRVANGLGIQRNHDIFRSGSVLQTMTSDPDPTSMPNLLHGFGYVERIVINVSGANSSSGFILVLNVFCDRLLPLVTRPISFLS